MKRIICILLLSISPVFGQQSIESGWKGIKVFATDRAAVTAILGKPDPNVDKIYTIYSTKDQKVTVVYSESPCENAAGEKGDFKLKKGTVLDYRVSFEKPFPLTDLSWSKESYIRSEDPHRLDVFTYFDSNDGLTITTGVVNGTEMVGGFWFRASDKLKRQFRCRN